MYDNIERPNCHVDLPSQSLRNSDLVILGRSKKFELLFELDRIAFNRNESFVSQIICDLSRQVFGQHIRVTLSQNMATVYHQRR